MRLCFSANQYSPFFGAPFGLDEVVAAVGAAGFAGIGLDRPSIDAHLAGSSGSGPSGASVAAVELSAGRRTLAGVAGLLAAAGLRCEEVAGLEVGLDDTATMEEARRCAEVAGALSATYVLTYFAAPPDDATVDRLRRCADLIAPTGARLALECMPFTPVDRIAVAASLARQVGSERAGVLVDTWHLTRSLDTWADLEALAVDEIAYLQLADGAADPGDDLVTETMHHRAMPGAGAFDLHGFTTRIEAAGYDGLVSVEVLDGARRDESPATFAREAFDAAVRCWPRLAQGGTSWRTP